MNINFDTIFYLKKAKGNDIFNNSKRNSIFNKIPNPKTKKFNN